MNYLNFFQHSMKMLTNLSAILDKAAAYGETKKVDFGVFLQTRLAPDQFDLKRQIQIACDTVKFGASRLTGKDAPTHADDEKSLSELKARIQSVQSYLESYSEADFAEASSKKVTTPRWDGQYLTGDEYLQCHVIPNFYFHMTTAYSILRANGVDIGKKDYLGKMPFKR